MDYQRVKEIILEQCHYERKIVMRNSVVILIIVAIILYFAYPFIGELLFKMSNQKFQMDYYKYIVPIVAIAFFIYPFYWFWNIMKRADTAKKVFERIENQEACHIILEESTYLTTIPLYYVNLKLNPIDYLTVMIGRNNYKIPYLESLGADIKSILSNVDISQIYDIKKYIYTDEPIPNELKDETPLKTEAAFAQFSSSEIAPMISGMETQRSSSKNMYVVQLLIVLLIFGAVLYLNITGAFQKIEISTILIGFVLIGFGLPFLFYMYAKSKPSSMGADFTQFKTIVYKKIINFINPNFNYSENGHIVLSEFLHSGLFRNNSYKLTGGDQIAGIYQNVPFQNCSLVATYRPNFRNEKEADDVVFSGQYFVAKFPKSFQSPIYLIPKKGFFEGYNDNDIETYLNTSGEKIMLEDPEFNSQFDVYSPDQIIARYVLTPSLMERIKSINQKCKGNMYIALNNKNIVIAINEASESAIFDGVSSTLFSKIDQTKVDNIFEEIKDQFSIIDILKLNNTIWN